MCDRRDWVSRKIETRGFKEVGGKRKERKREKRDGTSEAKRK